MATKPVNRLGWTAVAIPYQSYDELQVGELLPQVVSQHGLDLPTAQAYAQVFREQNTDPRYRPAVLPSARYV